MLQCGCDDGVTVVFVENTVTRFQILDDDVFISHKTDTRRKGIHPIIPLPVMGK